MVSPAALVDCCLASLRSGVCSPPWRWRGFRAGIDGCLVSSPSGEEVGSFSYTLAFLDLTLVLSRCKNLAWLVS